MSKTVLFVGGPLHGDVRALAGMTATIAEAPLISLESYGLGDVSELRQVTYSVSRFAMCGRIIWIAHLGAEPGQALAFDALASDGAKAASVIAAPVTQGLLLGEDAGGSALRRLAVRAAIAAGAGVG